MSNAAVFFDRDGTLIDDPGYLNHPDQVKLLDGACEVLKELQLLDYKVIVVSNQSGVARGVVTEEMLERIHEHLKALLAQKGAALDNIYYCPYHPDGVIPKYRKESDWRKPKPGMLLAAAEEMDLDLTKSWMVGDAERDVEAGRSAGCQTILISATHARQAKGNGKGPDHVAVNIREAANIIKKHHRALQKDHTEHLWNEPTDSASVVSFAGNLPHPENVMPETSDLQVATTPGKQEAAAPSTEQLLIQILDQLKRMQKTEMFGEFSIMRLLAGVVQVFVPFCLLIAVWFLMTPDEQNGGVTIALGFAGVLQMMALTFYIMQGRR